MNKHDLILWLSDVLLLKDPLRQHWFPGLPFELFQV
jgi:hypothetical protein